VNTLLNRPPTEFRTTATAPKAAAAPHRRGGIVLFVALASLYFAVGYVLMMRYNLFEGDAASRVANAGFVLYSRDPHLSAVGFVWNPLPSLVEVPILLVDHWWPELRTRGLAGVIQSAAFMAAAAVMVRRIALDRGVGSGWHRISVACFALQPMIVLYGASGMSEAAETFCLLWCVRHLMLWSDDPRIRDLAWAGIALGVGYLARYEVVPAALGAAVLVAVLVARRANAETRLASTLSQVAVVLFPITLATAIWALSGWVVNHELFATLTSQYGNERQVTSMRQRGDLVGDSPSQWVVISARLLGIQPFVGIAAAAAVAYAAVARKPATLVPVAIFGPVLAFAAWGQYSSTTFGWFRYFLLAIPMVVCIALACWTPTDGQRPPWAAEKPASRFAGVLLCVSILVGFPVTVRAALNEHIGNQPYQSGFNSLLHPQRYPAEDQPARQLMVNDRRLGDYLDRHQLPDGAVLMDTAYTWGVWLSSADPKQFIITSDYDFKAALNRPWKYGVTYLLVTNPSYTDADAINLRYPTLWNDGAGFAKLVMSVDGAAREERFRLYKVTGPPKPSTSDSTTPASEAAAPDPSRTTPGSDADRDPGRGTPGG
jgi:Dolichyl-phosphate-mannose-protein mannosyltransferase